MNRRHLLLFLTLCPLLLFADVELGIDQLFDVAHRGLLKNKRVGLITNSSAINKEGVSSLQLLRAGQIKHGYTLKTIFAPEHGLEGKLNAFEHVKHGMIDKTPIYSLHGATKRPTPEMLKDIDILIYDIQNVGSRCYTYETTLFYAMEEAAKQKLMVLVLDRPDPRGGDVVEGLLIEDRFKCFFCYNNVPFCHGMTIGELAQYFNAENKLDCPLKIIPMKGWEHGMRFSDTGLKWASPSPNIPDVKTTLVYPATILLGETLEIVSVDLRGEHPFKRLGAPWISNEELMLELNQANLPGILFYAHVFTPKWGKYKGQKCEGVYLKVSNEKTFRPMLTQYIIMEKLKKLYPKEFDQELQKAYKKRRKITCNYITGSEELTTAIENQTSISSYMKSLEEIQMKEFLKLRKKYLLY